MPAPPGQPLPRCPLPPLPPQVIAESQPGPGGEARPFYDFLEACLRHKSEVVIFEAARAICNMRDVTARELTPAVTVLQLFLSSSKPVLRFAAVRTLNKARRRRGRLWGGGEGLVARKRPAVPAALHRPAALAAHCPPRRSPCVPRRWR